jgi:hypothetical protein
MPFAEGAAALVVLGSGQQARQLKDQRQFGIHLRMVLRDHHQLLAATLADLLRDPTLSQARIHRCHRRGQVARCEPVLAGRDLVALGGHLGLGQALAARRLEQTDQIAPSARGAGPRHALAIDGLAVF